MKPKVLIESGDGRCEWFDAAEWDLRESIKEFAGDDWFIVGCRDLPDINEMGRNLNKITAWAEAVDEHGNAALIYFDMGYRDPGSFADRYRGCYECMRDYAEGILDISDLPEWAQRYFDWDAYCLDLENDVSVEYTSEGVYIFSY